MRLDALDVVALCVGGALVAWRLCVFRRPARRLGLAEEVFSWDAAASLVRSGRVELLGRDARTLEAYDARRAWLAERYASPGDYIMERAFGYPVAEDARGRLAAVRAHQPSATVAVMDNEFPYAFRPEDRVRHAVLWSLVPLGRDEVERLAREMAGGGEVLWWVNKPARQSVPSLFHAHVLLRWAAPAGDKRKEA